MHAEDSHRPGFLKQNRLKLQKGSTQRMLPFALLVLSS